MEFGISIFMTGLTPGFPGTCILTVSVSCREGKYDGAGGPG